MKHHAEVHTCTAELQTLFPIRVPYLNVSLSTRIILSELSSAWKLLTSVVL